jgi:hypothetical protein
LVVSPSLLLLLLLLARGVVALASKLGPLRRIMRVVAVHSTPTPVIFKELLFVVEGVLPLGCESDAPQELQQQ